MIKLFFALIVLAFFLSSESRTFAQVNDFFSSTTGSNSRFKNNPALAAAPTNCLTCPGWNPCNGITATGGASCDGNGLLRQSTLGPVNGDGTQYLDQVGLVGLRPDIITKNGDGTLLTVKASPLFASTGPGAVTDNMFGAVSDPTRTNSEIRADVLAGTNSTKFGKGSRAPSKCGNTASDGSFDSTIDQPDPVNTFFSGLNCGYLRYDLATQGVTPPSGSNTFQLGQTMSSLTTMSVTSGSPANTCVLSYNTDGTGNATTSGNSTTPIVPRLVNTGQNCDMVNFNAAAHAFTSNIFPTGTDWSQTGIFTGIPNGLYNNFTFSRDIVCRSDGGATDTICTRQSLIQDTQTENGTSHAEWAFIWSSRDTGGGAPASSVTDCGGQANPTGKICVHWFSDYEDSPCKIVGVYDVNAGANKCRGVATGYGFLDVSEGYFTYNGDAAAATSVSYPLGPQMSFGDINGAVSP